MAKAIIHEHMTKYENAEINASTLAWSVNEGVEEFVYDEWFDDNFEGKADIENYVNSKEFREVALIRAYHYFKAVVLDYIERNE